VYFALFQGPQPQSPEPQLAVKTLSDSTQLHLVETALQNTKPNNTLRTQYQQGESTMRRDTLPSGVFSREETAMIEKHKLQIQQEA
jgi:hypothetical protein